MNFSYLKEYTIKIPTLIIGLFLIIGTTFVSCDVTQTEDEAQLIDVQSQKAQLDNKFGNLSNSLKDLDQSEVTPEMFKQAALKHIDGVEKGDENFSQAAANYDKSFRKAKIGNSMNKLATHSMVESTMEELTYNIQKLDSFEKVNQVFDKFYTDIKNNDSYSVKEKNRILQWGINFQSMLGFVESNHKLLLSINETNQQSINAKYAKEEEEGWWESWGKCAAGILGGAGSEAIAGCALSAVPTAGFGCPAGAAGGAVIGALTGAAAAC